MSDDQAHEADVDAPSPSEYKKQAAALQRLSVAASSRLTGDGEAEKTLADIATLYEALATEHRQRPVDPIGVRELKKVIAALEEPAT
ncbi:hypothetical protein ACFL59_09505 [Planctomycetota bacterium]